MSNIVKVSLRISGRDLTLACPENEKDQLIKSAKLLNAELENIKDKNNALIIAG
jgi:cell division protein ZapA (FtsZ GTPase activity inhibitor)